MQPYFGRYGADSDAHAVMLLSEAAEHPLTGCSDYTSGPPFEGMHRTAFAQLHNVYFKGGRIMLLQAFCSGVQCVVLQMVPYQPVPQQSCKQDPAVQDSQCPMWLACLLVSHVSSLTPKVPS